MSESNTTCRWCLGAGHIEAMTVTLETADKLSKAGCSAETVFAWEITHNELVPTKKLLHPTLEYNNRIGISAPTAQEIANQLPREVHPGGFLRMSLGVATGESDSWTAAYGMGSGPKAQGDTIAEALAALWLKLQEAAMSKSNTTKCPSCKGSRYEYLDKAKPFETRYRCIRCGGLGHIPADTPEPGGQPLLGLPRPREPVPLVTQHGTEDSQHVTNLSPQESAGDELDALYDEIVDAGSEELGWDFWIKFKANLLAWRDKAVREAYEVAWGVAANAGPIWDMDTAEAKIFKLAAWRLEALANNDQKRADELTAALKASQPNPETDK